MKLRLCCCCWARGRNAYTQDCQENVDAEVATAPALEENTEGGKEDSEDYLADVAVGICQLPVGDCGAGGGGGSLPSGKGHDDGM
jgi:hypothetical protein